MGGYHPMSMKIGAQTKKKTCRVQNSQYRKCRQNLKMVAGAILEIQVSCNTVGNYHPILMQVGKQTKINMLSSKITKAEV
jgi:hypothetical protein